MTGQVTAIGFGRQSVDIYATRDVLAVSTVHDLSQKHTDWLLVINTKQGIFSVRVTDAEKLPENHKHDWLVDIECDEMDALREALTYQVVGYALDVPEMQE